MVFYPVCSGGWFQSLGAGYDIEESQLDYALEWFNTHFWDNEYSDIDESYLREADNNHNGIDDAYENAVNANKKNMSNDQTGQKIINFGKELLKGGLLTRSDSPLMKNKSGGSGRTIPTGGSDGSITNTSKESNDQMKKDAEQRMARNIQRMNNSAKVANNIKQVDAKRASQNNNTQQQTQQSVPQQQSQQTQQTQEQPQQQQQREAPKGPGADSPNYNDGQTRVIGLDQTQGMGRYKTPRSK